MSNTFPCIKAGHGDPVWLGFQHPAKESEIAPEEQTIQLSLICRRPRSVPCRLPHYWFSLCEPLWIKLSWFYIFSCVSLDSSGSYSPSPTPSFSSGFPELYLKFGCGFLYLFLSIAVWWLSDDNYARHQSQYSRISLAIITLTFFFISSHVWFNPSSLGDPACGDWYSRQCQGWAYSPKGVLD